MPIDGGASPNVQPPPADPPVRVGRIEFGDIEQLSAATRQANVEMHLARGGRYRGGVLDVESGGVAIQWGWHSAPTVARGEVWDGGAFLAQWSGAPARVNGVELSSGGFIWYPPGWEHQARTDGPVSWVSIRIADLPHLVATLAPDVAASAGAMRYFETARRRLDDVRRVLWDVRHAAESGGAGLADPAAPRALRETVGAALVRAMADDRPRRSRESLAACSMLVRRAEEALRACAYQPVYISELCAAVGASEARLRQAFQKVYGIGPVRYLRVRRLHLVRRALRTTRRDELTVSRAAARLGFFEFGRFAGEYEAFFGELPSRTRRAP